MHLFINLTLWICLWKFLSEFVSVEVCGRVSILLCFDQCVSKSSTFVFLGKHIDLFINLLFKQVSDSCCPFWLVFLWAVSCCSSVFFLFPQFCIEISKEDYYVLFWDVFYGLIKSVPKLFLLHLYVRLVYFYHLLRVH